MTEKPWHGLGVTLEDWFAPKHRVRQNYDVISKKRSNGAEIILVKVRGKHCRPYATWIRDLDTGDLAHGNYFAELGDAVHDWEKRR